MGDNTPGLQIYFGHGGSVLTTVRVYQPLLEFLERRLNVPVSFRWYPDHHRMFHDLRDDPSLLALVDGTTYLYLAQKSHVCQIGVARKHERMTRRGYLVARPNSGIRRVSDLRGKSVAVVARYDAISYLWLARLVGNHRSRLEEFFEKVVVTDSPTESLLRVALGMVDVAAVDDWTYDSFTREHGQFRDRLRVRFTSPEFSNPVLVAGPKVDPELCRRLGEYLKAMGSNLEGSAVSLASGIDGFVSQPPEFFEADRLLLPFLSLTGDLEDGARQP